MKAALFFLSLLMAAGVVVPAVADGVPEAGAGGPVITEILTGNRGGWRDEDGDSPDWVEIYNPGPGGVELGGWYLSDAPRVLTRWRFPVGTLLPEGGRLVIFASGKDRAVAGRPLHTSFKLGSDGESVLLVAPDGVTVVSRILRYPAQRENVSYGDGWDFAGVPLLGRGTEARVLIPTGPVPGWTDPDYEDGGWGPAVLGVGFDAGGGAAEDGLLGWWNFDEAGNQTRAVDGTGQGRDGVVARAVFSADGEGRSGRAGDRSMVFGGSGVVSFPAAAAGVFDGMVARDAFTFSLWVHGAATLPQDNYLFYGSTGTGGGGQRALDVHLPWSDSVIYFDTGGCCDTGATRIQVSEPDATRWRGRWNHYVFVKNGSSKQIWQNGRLLHQGTNTAKQTSLRSFFLGAMNGAGATGYRGRIDDFAVWEGALEEAEIVALAEGVAPPEVRRFTPFLGTDVGAAMRGVSASALVRVPFMLDEEEAGLDLLRLRMRSDDGFVVWLNGVEVARRRAPEGLTEASAATDERGPGAAMVVEEMDLSLFAPLLRPGRNVLAVQGLNRGVEDGTFLLWPELWAGRVKPGRYFPVPTPGEPNGAGVTGFVGPVRVFPERGFRDEPVTVTLTCATPGAILVYTTDGSVPRLDHGRSGASPMSVEIARTTLLRVAAFSGELASSGVATHTYLFVDQVAGQQRPSGALAVWPDGSPGDYAMDARVPGAAPAPGYSLRESLLALPSLSLSTDPGGLWGAGGIYANPTSRGREWERRASAEWLDPGGTGGFQVGAGLRVHGNISRNKSFTPKHGFSLRFRGEYGDTTLKFPLFPGSPVEEFDQLVLRAGSTDTWPCTEWPATGLGRNGELYQRWNRDWASYVRDQWARDAHLAMGGAAFRGRFCHLYLNGLYWGLYNVTEAPSASHMAAHGGGQEREWDTVADFSELRDGTREAWDRLLGMANRGQLSSDAGLRRVQGLSPDGVRDPALPRLLEVDDLIDYMILHISMGADDWPNHNWWGARRSRAEDPEGFRFFVWDQEISNENVEHARSAWGPVYAEANADGTPTRVYAQLRSSPEFRLRFADRVHRHLFHGGVLTRERNVDRWRVRTAEIDRALVAESARWGDAQPNRTRPGQPYTREGSWLPHLAWMEEQYWARQPEVALARFRAAGLFPAVSPPRLSPHGGAVAAAGSAVLSDPGGAGGTIFYTTTGQDPRQWGGAVHPEALSAMAEIVLRWSGPVVIRARVRQGGLWSALTEVSFAGGNRLDRDGDGMDDGWEAVHGLSADDAADAWGDLDGDGWTNLEEYVALSDPRSAASRLSLQVASGVELGEGEVVLWFRLEPGRVYELEQAGPWEGPGSWVTGPTFGPEAAAREVRWPVPAGGSARLYRLRVSLAP